MASGVRWRIAAQAALVWSSGDLGHFVETGQVPNGDDDLRVPYSEELIGSLTLGNS